MNQPADPDSIAIAQLLGISTETYLAKVTLYRASPSLDPEIEIDESAPEPRGGVDAIISAAESEDSAATDAFEPVRARVVAF